MQEIKEKISPYPELEKAMRNGEVILFLGAGASIGSKDATGKEIPMAPQLSSLIIGEFLDDGYEGLNFSTVLDYAITQSDVRTVQSFIRDKLQEFDPADFHDVIPKLRWGGIVTTNYDQIIEKAYARCADPTQKIKIIRDDADFDVDPGGDLHLIKIHGCLSLFEKTSVPLVGSTEQLIKHKKGRKVQVQKFVEWCKTKYVVFAGYKMADENLRTIYQQIIDEGDNHPPHYIVDPNLLPAAQHYWNQRRVRPLKMSFGEFLCHFDETIPDSARVLGGYFDTTKTTHFTKFISVPGRTESGVLKKYVAEQVTIVSEELAGGPESARRFYRGDSTGWNPVRNNWDIERRVTRTLTQEDLIDANTLGEKFVVIKGNAGSGKTTTLKRAAWQAALSQDKLCVFVSANSSISITAFEEIFSLTNRVLHLFVDGLSLFQNELVELIDLARKRNWPLVVIGTERVNEWNVSCEGLSSLVSNEYHLRRLSEDEAGVLLEKLATHNCLGSLAELEVGERLEKLLSNYERELLVALYETTQGADLREIVKDEFETILNRKARLLYLDICGLHRFRVPVRAGLIARIHDVSFQQFQEEFLLPLEDVVRLRMDRRSGDYVYESRHPVIADIVFDEGMSNNEEKYEFVSRIVSKLNLSFSYDREVLGQLINAGAMRNAIPDPAKARIIFRSVVDEVGLEAYVLHQWAIYEMQSSNSPDGMSRSERLLEEALEIDPGNRSIRHSLAELALKKSRLSQDPNERSGWQIRAQSRASALAQNSRTAHPHHTLAKVATDILADVMKVYPSHPSETETRELNEAIRTATEAVRAGLDRFPSDTHLLKSQAELWQLLRDMNRAEASLRKAFEANPASELIAKRLVSMLKAEGKVEETLSTLRRAVEANPSSQDLRFLLAEALLDQPPYDGEIDHIEVVMYHLKRSFTPGDKRYQRQYWYARQILLLGHVDEARSHFDTLRNAPIPYEIRKRVRGYLRGANGEKRTYRGEVLRILPEACFVSVPELNSSAFLEIPDEDPRFEGLEEGIELTFNLGLNFFGLVAEDPQFQLL